jgi:hypothetical protein
MVAAMHQKHSQLDGVRHLALPGEILADAAQRVDGIDRAIQGFAEKANDLPTTQLRQAVRPPDKAL